MPHLPRKRFGQHFLVDQSVITAIVDAIHPQPNDLMVEIGPGLEALTKPLVQKLRHLHVVEIDRDIVTRLENNYAKTKLGIHAADALKFDFGSLGSPLRVVGNLPYNISTPILFHLADFAPNISDMTFMLQKEVVERMVAAPSTSDYGRLSVALQYRFDMELLFLVSPEAFDPPPKVESAIVRMIPKPATKLLARDEILFAKITTTAFSQRRKTIRNTLIDFLTPDDFIKLNLDSKLRAENLSVADYLAIANYLHEK
ncbi:MAG: ribosomal small subunit methyltransferase [Pseudomonadota bacterium]|jgi:16S rRNA (adenine1518-N6/adenine1519-N6)-dimethyltransferase